MLTTQDWLDASYRRYDGRNSNGADFLLQKRFDDAEGKRYFLSVWVWDNTQYDFHKRNPSLPKMSYQPEVQFQRKEEITLNVTFLMNEDSTIADVEQQAEKLWLFLDKPYYEKWEDYK